MKLGLILQASLSVFAIALTGCSSDDGDDSKTPDPGEESLTGCGINTGFKGDEVCLKQPTNGVQLHYGPSNYDDQAEMEKYYIDPGEEFVSCFYTKTTNETDAFFNEYHARLRPGSHHLRIFAINDDRPEGVGPCGLGDSVGARFLFGATSPTIDVPDKGEEFGNDVSGVAIRLPARSQIVMEVHFYNTGQERLLQEAWANFGFTDTYDVLGDAISLIGGVGMAVRPGTTELIKGSTVVPEDIRALVLVGHYHAHTTRFSAWHTPVGGERTLVNESFDWGEPATFRYDTKHQNPTPDRELKRDGASSGPLHLKKGDTVDWECEIVNDTTDVTLRFANEVYTGEMCNVFGLYIPSMGGTWNAYN
jgi:hypothetical protein